MAVWLKLETLDYQSVFDTAGGSSYGGSRYHLEIKDHGMVRWFHRNEQGAVIFNVLTEPLIKTGKWTHLVATYNGAIGMARVG